MPKRKTLSQEAMETRREANTQKVEVEAKRAKSAKKKAQKEAIIEANEDQE